MLQSCCRYSTHKSIREQAERVVQPGEEKALGRPYNSLPVLKWESTRKMGKDSLSLIEVIG